MGQCYGRRVGVDPIAATRFAIRRGFKDDVYKDFHLRILDKLETTVQSLEYKLIGDALGYVAEDLSELCKFANARSLRCKISSLLSSFVNARSLAINIKSLTRRLIYLYSVCQYLDENITWEQLKVIAKSCPAARLQKTKTLNEEFEISKMILDEVPEVHAYVNKALRLLCHWSCRISSLEESTCLTHDKQTRKLMFLDSVCQFIDLKITQEQLKVIEESCQPASANPRLQKTTTHLTQCQHIENLHKQTDEEFEISKLILDEDLEVHGYASKVLNEWEFVCRKDRCLMDRICYVEQQETRIAMIEDAIVQFNDGKITREQLKVIAETSVKPTSPSSLRFQDLGGAKRPTNKDRMRVALDKSSKFLAHVVVCHL